MLAITKDAPTNAIWQQIHKTDNTTTQKQQTATTTMTRQRIIQFMRFTSSSSSKLELHQLWLWHLPPSSFVRLLFLLFFLRRKTISIAAAPLPLSKDMPYFRLHNKFANHVLSSSSSSLGLGHCMPHRHQRRQRQRRAWHQVPVVAIASISAPPPPLPACLVFCALLCCAVCVCLCCKGHLATVQKKLDSSRSRRCLVCLPACLPFWPVYKL